MAYKIQSSEKTAAKGAEYETKALLYLMNMREDSDEIYYFVVDFFNDLTGVDRFSKRTWDLQSKGKSDNFPADLGKELVTLFKNYVSELNFDNFILFVGGVADSIRIDNRKNIFDYNEIKSDARNRMKVALIKECQSKTYISNKEINDANIDSFLSKVTFVIGGEKKSDYVRSIVKVNPLIIPSDDILEGIFNQIRDAQSGKKNNGNVEGITVNALDEFLYHSRYLTSNEIKLMVLNRIINNNIMQRGATHSFIPIYSKIPAVDQKNKLEDCQNALAKTLFDKNNADNFWKLFNNIYSVITRDKDSTIDDLYKMIDINILSNVDYLDTLSTKYFMAIVKDGIYEN